MRLSRNPGRVEIVQVAGKEEETVLLADVWRGALGKS